MKRSNRSVQKLVRLSPEENSGFVDLAEKRGTDFSELVRQLLHRELRAEQKAASAA
jgi:hypothetical protein